MKELILDFSGAGLSVVLTSEDEVKARLSPDRETTLDEAKKRLISRGYIEDDTMFKKIYQSPRGPVTVKAQLY